MILVVSPSSSTSNVLKSISALKKHMLMFFIKKTSDLNVSRTKGLVVVA